VTTARAKGLRESQILSRHVIPNALLPTVTLIALALGSILGGAIGVEQVFTWPGLGTLTIDAIQAKDYPILQGIFLFLTVSVVLANLLADLVYGLLDPRVRV
jgi:peptide/nickel transport system permease protein